MTGENTEPSTSLRCYLNAKVKFLFGILEAGLLLSDHEVRLLRSLIEMFGFGDRLTSFGVRILRINSANSLPLATISVEGFDIKTSGVAMRL